MPLTPSLGAQPSFFVVAQLFLFRDGRRGNALQAMTDAAKPLTDDDLRAFADLISKLPPPAPPGKPTETQKYARGRELVLKNHCTTCHNPDLSGREQMPRLANQREDYLLKALRAAAINAKGAENRNQYNCARNDWNRSRHIWDEPDKNGRKGAIACIVVPGFLPYYAKNERHNWRSLAWWIHDHLPYSALAVFPARFAFNLRWHQAPERVITSRAKPLGTLTRPGLANHEGSHEAEWRGILQ